MDEIRGEIKRVIFRNEQNGWSVIELLLENEETITATGTLPTCAPGERVELVGMYVEHRVYGRQFKANSCVSIAPASQHALVSYLGSGLIKGVGEATAKRIVAQFGMETLDVLENTPERLIEVEGIGQSRSKTIAASFFEQRNMRDIIMALQKYDISVRQAMQLYSIYGSACVAKVESDPYSLIEDVEGIGFKTADKIAMNVGLEANSPARLRAGLVYLLLWARQEGHTYLPRETLLSGAANLLGVDVDCVEDTLENLIIDQTLHYTMAGDTDALYLPVLYRMESEAANMLLSLCEPPEEMATLDLAAELKALERELNISLAPQQREAVLSALTQGAMVITGGPGTGKTTILQFIIHIMDRLGLDFALCAPTGRAAKRMTEATGFDASTIHRLLEYGGEGRPRFARDDENPLFYDMVVVDEMSMVDLPLFYALLRALPAGSRLVMVGDADQLPPVGAGTVLHDIIRSKMVEVIRLTEIYRQADRSGIAKNAQRINAGDAPFVEEDSDFGFISCVQPRAALEKTVSICMGTDPLCYAKDAQRDIQVLSPTKKGPLGVRALNERLQRAINPPEPHKAEREFGETVFREGDKVMQIKNNYRVEWAKTKHDGNVELGEGVFNGDLGTILRMNTFEQTLDILFDDERMATYSFTQLDELDLAYCISIHKSQGSEFPVVVLPLLNGPPMLMTRNLLYTAVTRARNQVLIVGDWQTVLNMVKNTQTRRRYSALDQRLSDLAHAFEV
ncbi:ATP-dependent RecD-like DNA helicase [Eubacteriales bacterium OttesenSCG-928-K08]|nr:ATP-dependent RecD-like DNA helicase [Eubacteriales bacterium OttesenSCG-928-K08]